ncbi:hypothetical protein COLO4_15039 [Corchorus olitorius]|uniref:Uncharacterized protein n=1 Tax=Corchorus olitorius TaxID=93759 RepID=A0A1R3JQ73_9ROSI|nr:hypothetical protein COLO4_15039 [Corchorus olitorius]
MADALLSAVASTIVESISSLLSEEFGITGGLKTELKRMQSTFTTIQAVLVDAEEKQWTSEAIKDWLRKLKATAYEVEDILDDFAANTPRGTQVNTLSRFPKQLSFHFKMAHKLRNVREKLDAIAGERSKFHLTEGIRAVEDRQVGLTVPKTVRHMFARSGTPNLHNVNFLRSLIVKAKKKGEEEFYLKIATKQKHLRALEVSFYSITMNLSFDNFRHLRYLNFRGFNISTLPESISSLRNLQTLNLRDCRQLRTLPKGLKHLKSLIYLDIGGCISLTCMPDGLGQLSSLRVLSKFIVGKDHGCHIDELKEMALEGELRIKELDNVKSSADARSANLNMKQNLRSLSLEWRESKSNDGARDENGEDVLTGLQPHPNLKKLSITSYHGARFSNWLMDLLVVEISLEKCGRCECLPPLGKLSFLKVLDIFRMDALKSIDSSFYGDGETSFPSLESLRLTHMPCLEEWTTINDGRESFPLLSSLTITNCPKLVEIPPVLELSLKSLQIYGNFTISLLNSVVHLTSLTFLSVYGLIDLTVVPEGVLQHHKHLEELALSGLRRLKSLSDVLDNLSALKHLKISFCDELESLPAGLENLSSLESLLLFRCDSLVGLPENGLRGLSSLSILSIKNCEKLESLSEGVRYLTSLRDLQIWECPELKSLPESIQHLTSLSSLRIDRCENLMSLPRGLQSLTALKELSITECPNVERRCKAEGGEDWPFIAHIPTVQIRSGKEYSRR